MSYAEHKSAAQPIVARAAVVTLSDTRTEGTDTSGRAIRRKSSRNGASPRRTRAWVMADLHANPRVAPSQCSQRSPSTNSRSTASYEA